MDIDAFAAAWRRLRNHTSVELRPIETGRHYRAMVNLLDELVDVMGERESHPLTGVLDIVSFLVRDYEDRNIEMPHSAPHEVLRFFMHEHNLRPVDLVETLG